MLFDHEKLRVYQASVDFVAWVEDLDLRRDRKVSAQDHINRASASMPVNIAEASGKSSMKERRQFIDTAYGSSLECAACLDIFSALKCISNPSVQEGKNKLSSIVAMLIRYRESTSKQVQEEPASYSAENPIPTFAHEKLDVYQRALELVAWYESLSNKNGVSRSTVTALDKASTGVVLNIAEGNGKFSTKDRCRFISHARTAALQAAATLDIASVRHPHPGFNPTEGKAMLADIVRMLVAWHRSLNV